VNVRTLDGRRKEIRTVEFGSSAIPLRNSGFGSAAGVPATYERVVGLPAVAKVLKSIANSTASLVFNTYRKVNGTKAVADDTWQYRLLAEQPALDVDAFTFVYDLVISLEATGNAFLHKLRSPKQIEELHVLDPQRMKVTPDRLTGKPVYSYWKTVGATVDIPAADILHIRHFSTNPGALVGTNPIALMRDQLSVGIALQQFEGHFFRYGARPGIVLEYPPNVPKERAKEWVDMWNAEHMGVENSHKTGAIGGGGKLVTIPFALEDAMFADAKKHSVEDVARMWDWPRDMMELPETVKPLSDEQHSIHLVKFYVLPRLRRIESAFKADQDLFGGLGSNLYPEFMTDTLTRADRATRFNTYLQAKQGGWMTANEIRADEGLPPHADGDVLQITPVGGGANASDAPPSETGSTSGTPSPNTSGTPT
jgi:HK97 family phage portal protein